MRSQVRAQGAKVIDIAEPKILQDLVSRRCAFSKDHDLDFCLLLGSSVL